MARELFTSWGEYQTGIDRILAAASEELCIFDPDLTQLKLESATRIERLQSFLQAKHNNRIRIALRSARFFREHCPHLQNLLRLHNERLEVLETADHLAHLRDCMLLVDSGHGLIRFDQDQARSKLVTEEPESMTAYRQRFQEIWEEGGTPVSATTLGL